MSTDYCACLGLHDITEAATDVEITASGAVRDYVVAHGGRLFGWISVHPAFPCPLCLLEVSVTPPKRDLGFRRVSGPGFDVYLEATQRFWPKQMEFGRRWRHLEAYWNGLAWIA
jgi:hypothetical protein